MPSPKTSKTWRSSTPNPVANATESRGSWTSNSIRPCGATWPSPGATASPSSTRWKQLGLKLAPEKYPTPVIVVDKVDEKPTPNAPGLDKALPPPPPAEFDVAVLTPSKPDAQETGRITANQVNETHFTVKLIEYAWNLNTATTISSSMPPNGWRRRLGPPGQGRARGPVHRPRRQAPVRRRLLPHMVQALLADRFQMKSHLEDRTIEAFTLVAANPHMTKADPINRTGCKEGPGPDG